MKVEGAQSMGVGCSAWGGGSEGRGQRAQGTSSGYQGMCWPAPCSGGSVTRAASLRKRSHRALCISRPQSSLV